MGRLQNRLEPLGDFLHRVISMVLQWTLLPLVMLLLFVPYRGFMWLCQRDQLARTLNKNASSYWQPASESSQREKQF